MALTLDQIRDALKDGLLSFPVTDMDETGQFNPSSYAKRIEWFLTYPTTAVFAAGGTGEFFSLSEDEYRRIVQTAVETVNEQVPVISSVGRSIPEAISFARIAKDAGVNALLLMPPYLVNGPERGVFEYARTIIQNTSLPVIYYNRANGILSTPWIQQLADLCDNLIGVKDGTGNIQDLNDMIRSLGDRLFYIGGVPTAEIIAEAYLSIGVNTYSSAVFNFVPELAIRFYQALRAGDHKTVDYLMKTFYIPLVRLRSKNKGYAVSLIKAGAKLIGRSAGDVRSPLTMPTDEEVAELRRIVEESMFDSP